MAVSPNVNNVFLESADNLKMTVSGDGKAMTTISLNAPNQHKTIESAATACGRTIEAEVLAVSVKNFPSRTELERRRKAFEELQRSRPNGLSGTHFPTTEDMIREDRER